MEKVCPCGYDRFAPLVYQNPVYGVLGWLALILGATPKPKRVEYRCSRCQYFFGYTIDPEILKKVQ